MSNRMITGIIILILIILIGYSSIFTVKEGSAAAILRLGELNKNSDGSIRVYEPGLHFKIPVLDQLKVYDMRLKTLTSDSSRVVTQEQKDVLIDAYLQWRISNIALFFTSTNGNVLRVDNLLEQYLESALRAEVGNNTIESLINDSRDKLMTKLLNKITSQAKEIGIDIMDVRIKQIDLPNTVTESIFSRMRSDRHQVAASIRAEGGQEAEVIRANADATHTVILAKANKESLEIKAQGEAKANQIYIDEYKKSQDFYRFLRSMKAYTTSFDTNKENVFIVSPNSPFLKDMKLST